MMRRTIGVGMALAVTVAAWPPLAAQNAEQTTREAMYYRYLEFASYVKGGSVEPHWMADGSIWEVKYEYEYLYEYYPDVIICPSRGKLAINGKMLSVEQVGAGKSTTPKSGGPSPKVIESQIDGDFEGWEGETIVKLTNGQIWQQSEYYYHYHYAFMARVLVFRSGGGYKMKVDGVEKSVGVTRLN